MQKRGEFKRDLLGIGEIIRNLADKVGKFIRKRLVGRLGEFDVLMSLTFPPLLLLSMATLKCCLIVSHSLLKLFHRRIKQKKSLPKFANI